MATKTSDPGVPPQVRPLQFPAFAVTVDVVVLTVAEAELQVLLVRRGVPPFEGMWAIPGGFKRPEETLDDAATRELREETGVDGATMRQFGAYGDPGRDRMNVVTVAYFSVQREVERVAGGTTPRPPPSFPWTTCCAGRSTWPSITRGSCATRSSASASTSSSRA